jgi:hypothetical protein
LQLFLGENLKTIEESFRRFYDRTSEIGQNELVMCLKPYFQTILNLQSTQGDWTSICQLNGEVMLEEEFFYDVDKAGNAVLKVVTILLKAFLADIFENFTLATSLYEVIEKKGNVFGFPMVFYHGGEVLGMPIIECSSFLENKLIYEKLACTKKGWKKQ